MEHLGWNSIIPSRSSAWSSQQQEELQQAAAKGFNTMWMNLIDSGFPTLDDISNTTANSNNNDVDYSRAEKLYHTPAADPAGLNIVSLNQHQEIEVSIFGNAFSQQQQQNLSSSASSSQLSDYILSNAYSVEDHFSANGSTPNNNNAKLLGGEGMPSSAVLSKKRKAALTDAHIGNATPTEMINFSDDNVQKKRRISTDRKELPFGSTNLENNEYNSSSSAEGGSGGFKLITSKKALTPPASKKSSNINFQLNATSSDNDSQPDSEAIAEMKEMIYRAAAFRPVILGLDEVAEKPKRKNVKISSDPQTSAARQRRERISERIRVLQRIVPGGNKMDTATMLDEAANYLRFLRSQVKALEKTTPTGSFGFSSYNFLP